MDTGPRGKRGSGTPRAGDHVLIEATPDPSLGGATTTVSVAEGPLEGVGGVGEGVARMEGEVVEAVGWEVGHDSTYRSLMTLHEHSGSGFKRGWTVEGSGSRFSSFLFSVRGAKEKGTEVYMLVFQTL